MTPQMQQSLKVLQMSHVELEAFVHAELEANPLLQKTENRRESAPSISSAVADDFSIERFGAVQHSLQDHIAEQINLTIRDSRDRKIAEALAASLDEAGYLHADLTEIARQSGVTTAQIEKILLQCQSFEPAGLFARNLAECLRLQLQASDRLSTAMRILLDHLDLVGKRDFARLKKLCDRDDEDLAEMLAEIRALDPKPGLVFDSAPSPSIIPDILVHQHADGHWHLELNPQTLPRVLVDEDYSRQLSRNSSSKEDKDFLRNCRQKANWLTRILDQRARTILNVASEIIRQQQQFLENGPIALKPMTMQMVADAINMHESTISRVAGQKYILTPFGLCELRYFFNATIKSATGADGFASEAVRSKIRLLIEQETNSTILSDEALAERLKADGILIARRTVAKYREELHIPSSAKRRREMQIRTKHPASVQH